MEKRPGEVIFLCAALVALAGLFYCLAPTGLASNEEGVQYVQMKNFALNGSFEITSPAQSLGFESADVTGMRGLLEARDGRLYATPPPLFPWVASLFFPVFGERTVDFAPILFVFLSALVLGLILDRVMQRDFLYWLLLAAFLLGSPVLMQGFQFSGMGLALFLIVSALLFLVSHFGDYPSAVKLFGAAFLMGASALVRMECMLIALSFCVSATMVFVFQKRMRELWTVLAGEIFGLAVFVLHDVLLHGYFPGPSLQLYLPFYSLSSIRVAALGGSLALSFVLIILSLREEIGPVRKAVLSFLPVILLLGVVLLTTARITVSHLMAVFFPAVLFVFYGVLRAARAAERGKGRWKEFFGHGHCLSGLRRRDPASRKSDVRSVWPPMVPFLILLIALERKVIFAARGMYIVLAFFCGVAFVNGIQESKDRILKYKDYNAAPSRFSRSTHRRATPSSSWVTPGAWSTRARSSSTGSSS